MSVFFFLTKDEMEGRLGWLHKTLATRRAKRGSVKVNKEGLRPTKDIQGLKLIPTWNRFIRIRQQRLPLERHEMETRVITLVNRNTCSKSNEPIGNQASVKWGKMQGSILQYCSISLMPEAIFLEISLIWHSQERFPSMWTPRDFEVETCLIGNLLISIMGFLSSVDSLCLDPINKNSVLVVFSVSLFAASHIRILSKSMLTQRSISSTTLLA